MKDGAPTITTDGRGLRVAVVAASWHEQVMGGLLEGARRGLTDAGVTTVDVVRVPGTFELPVACASLADRYDALVALGVVIRGGHRAPLRRPRRAGRRHPRRHPALRLRLPGRDGRHHRGVGPRDDADRL